VEIKIPSKGDRLMLIKSVLSSISADFLLFVRIPALVTKKSEAIWRKFLWGVFWERFQISPCYMEYIINNPIGDGELVVRDLRLFNEALISMWLWRCMK